ncbi:hypothetical protein B7988_03325 [Fibrobacter sp. UWB1]|uniref:hypothetical protein n=1 Tax=Fibrobacter sp. UWB1 TaxID=1964355 RepID=UPI000B51FB59|nr:hypothetical protein [Fibrobacter sp. UWB1]OWV26639.1 hypothetical protein B7988_03325 [Fibrobacter sp. UWB1]
MTLEKTPALRAEFWENVNVLGSEGSFNQNLERAGRVAAFVSRRRQIKICRRRREHESYWRLWSAFRFVRSL